MLLKSSVSKAYYCHNSLRLQQVSESSLISILPMPHLITASLQLCDIWQQWKMYYYMW